MKLIKDGKVIEATEKVYNLIYKHRGFEIYNPDTHLLAYLEREINKVEEKLSNDFIADIEKAIEIYGEEVVFDHKTPAIDEEVILEPVIGPTESELNLEELNYQRTKANRFRKANRGS